MPLIELWVTDISRQYNSEMFTDKRMSRSSSEAYLKLYNMKKYDSEVWAWGEKRQKREYFKTSRFAQTYRKKLNYVRIFRWSNS
jgi:hypothetical protein